MSNCNESRVHIPQPRNPKRKLEYSSTSENYELYLPLVPKTEQFHVICNESISHRRTILVVEIVRRVKKLPAVELRNGACPLRKETETPRKDINIGQISQSICNLCILNTTTT